MTKNHSMKAIVRSASKKAISLRSRFHSLMAQSRKVDISQQQDMAQTQQVIPLVANDI